MPAATLERSSSGAGTPEHGSQTRPPAPDRTSGIDAHVRLDIVALMLQTPYIFPDHWIS
jgi:hypothetical protein